MTRLAIAKGMALALVLGLLLAGCAALAPTSLTPAQQFRLAEYKAFAHTVTAAYGKPDITIVVEDSAGYGPPTVSMMRPDGVMILSPVALTPLPSGLRRDFIVAHELGHYVLGHRSGGGVPHELDATGEAVKILVIGNGWTEQAAFEHAVRFLRELAAAQAQGRPVARGHLSACREIADLMNRYPAYAGQVLTC
jgi:hypothetical protein